MGKGGGKCLKRTGNQHHSISVSRNEQEWKSFMAEEQGTLDKTTPEGSHYIYTPLFFIYFSHPLFRPLLSSNKHAFVRLLNVCFSFQKGEQRRPHSWIEDEFSVLSLIQHYFHPLPHLLSHPAVSLSDQPLPLFAPAVLAFGPSFMNLHFLYFQSLWLSFLSSSTTWHPFPLTWEGPHFTHLFIHLLA